MDSIEFVSPSKKVNPKKNFKKLYGNLPWGKGLFDSLLREVDLAFGRQVGYDAMIHCGYNVIMF
jgi:hypothetical protein